MREGRVLVRQSTDPLGADEVHLGDLEVASEQHQQLLPKEGEHGHDWRGTRLFSTCSLVVLSLLGCLAAWHAWRASIPVESGEEVGMSMERCRTITCSKKGSQAWVKPPKELVN